MKTELYAKDNVHIGMCDNDDACFGFDVKRD